LDNYSPRIWKQICQIALGYKTRIAGRLCYPDATMQRDCLRIIANLTQPPAAMQPNDGKDGEAAAPISNEELAVWLADKAE
jgi:hypothetical protein